LDEISVFVPPCAHAIALVSGDAMSHREVQEFCDIAGFFKGIYRGGNY
jgi:hypothetical protein